jgi:hypothetical protein
VFQIELIRQLTFWSLFIVSAFLSVNLYTGLVDSIYDKGIMIFVAVALEGLKILCLTIANTARWQATQHKLNHIKEAMLGFFGSSKRKTIKDSELLRDVMDHSKKNRKAFYLYGAYVLTAFLSISASFGYVLVTVDRATTHALTTTNIDTISIYKQSSKQMDEQIKENQNSIAQYNKYIDTLDYFDDGFAKKRDAYQKKIDQLQQKNTDLLDKKLAMNTKIQELSVADVQVVKSTRKTMYQLMGEVLSIPDKSIMFILLYMLAILIEVGIFICSPHFHKMDDDDKVRADFTPRKKQKIPPQEDNPTPIIPQEDAEQYSKKVDEALAEPIPTENLVEAKVIPWPPEDNIVTSEEPPKKVEETILDEVIKEVTESEEVPIRITKSLTEKFIDALFNNDGHTYLKDKYEAADGVGMKRIEALRIFDYLARTKVNGYNMIEFRKDSGKWHPNLTSEVIKHTLESNLKKKE